ncbi:glucosamine--fructose-6-phosphate aminotransferase [isomerizing] [Ruminococcus sp. CAG:579]|jgi:glucosamine--fructose-6-phosphate aminotransferase (isomerizing)|uniref:glutamine--fructose-6-phosphate transaminase (isomerizing) n=1 Tax=Ruminococcus sp. 210702-SL.1.03 TaxID=2883233 RepID=UPI00033994B0|nr:glutamine--fructose-6-phosphate transaminase (isomerizing) [Ruminococcus sp. 210702-SL.1.03]MCB6615495.1 glutamine--fructose-6-phosphate transaminase (isomerizing) [Ruminococcus sp. 210702-SL.1.03]CDA72786.1 glucosamine--fructose-6-phosphate aminotransferase [isomerizing] [Ruminococcus sp. CAG:579]
MCGIVGYVGKKDCTKVLLDSLKKLEYRGYDSAGVAVFENGEIKISKSKGRLAVLEQKLQKEGWINGTCGIGHTRWATHGEPSDINSHPHGSARVTIVHNGIIENYQKIKAFLIKKGYTFESETDTETVAKLLDYYYEGDPMAAIQKVLGEIEGSYALGMMFKDFPNRVYAVRKDSPLIVGVGEDEAFIASDVPAIIKYTRNYYLIDQDEIVVLDDGKAGIYDIHGMPVDKELMTADWDMEAAEKGGYPHFMLKEINDQPTAIKTTITPRINEGMPDLSECGMTLEKLSGYQNIFVVACGTAMHAGLVGKYVIEQLARVPVTVDVASEFRYRNPILSDKDLVIVVSQSGETADTLEALRLSKNVGADTLAIVNVKGSSIAREADMVLYTHAGPEISVASTKAYIVQIAVFYLIAFELAFAKGAISEEECRRLTGVLQSVPDLINVVLQQAEQCKYIASKLINAGNLLYIGRGLDYALSMEGSLKLKEISYIHSESYAAGELKHGTISLVTEGMPVIAVATQRELFDKTVSNVKEVKARGASVIFVTHSYKTIESDVAEYKIGLPTIDDILMPLPAVVPLQLIAYYTAVLKGNDVDKPRNLAKSVTVE